VEQTYHALLFNSNDRRGFIAVGWTGEGAVQSNIVHPKNYLSRIESTACLPCLDISVQLDLTVQYVKDSIRRISLREDNLFPFVLTNDILSTIRR